MTKVVRRAKKPRGLPTTNKDWLKRLADLPEEKKILLLEKMPKPVLALVVKKMRSDMAYFFSVCLKKTHPYIPKHHKEAIKILSSDVRNICQIWYRGAGKTTIKRSYLLYIICFKLIQTIVLISETSDQAKTDTGMLMREIEDNQVIKWLFGDLKTKSPWGVKHLRFKNGVQVFPKGTGNSMRGMNADGHRPGLFVLDDFESEKNADTPEKRQALRNWLTGVVFPAGQPMRTRFFFIGTIVDPEAYLAVQDPEARDEDGELTEDAQKSIFRKDKGGAYTQFQLSDIPYDGTNADKIIPTWAEWQSLEFIIEEFEKYKNNNDLAMFFQEYYNIPKKASAPVIDVSLITELQAMLRHVGRHSYLEFPDGTKEYVWLHLGVDPNVKLGPDSDDFGMCLLALRPNKSYVICDIFAERIPIQEHKDIVVDMMATHKPRCTTIEAIAYQLSLSNQVQQELILRGFNYLWLNALERKTDKARSYMEIDGMIHLINNSKIQYLMGARNIDKLKSQAMAHTSGSKRSHDDTLDALYLSLQEVRTFPYPLDVDALIRQQSKIKSKKRKLVSFMGL